MDLREECPEVLQADVAIVGSGAAGNTLARSLLGRGFTVLLLESGGLDFEQETADLNRGRNIGQPYYDLDQSRLRFFGGTTAIWGGRCAELNAIDLEHRPWVPFSSWPITADELRPWYAEAREGLGVSGDESAISSGLLDRLAGPELKVRHWSFDSASDRFGAAKNRDLIEHPRALVAIHATVREIVPSPDVKSVDHLDIRSPAGRKHRAKAHTYILAAGGIENPRILLSSNSVAPAGLGNAHGLVGRFFMEHPHARGGRIVGAPVRDFLNAFRRKKQKGIESAPLITLSEEAQRRESLLNGALTIAARPPSSGRMPAGRKLYEFVKHNTAPTDRGRAFWQIYRRLKRTAAPIGSIAAAALCHSGMKELAIIIRAEQAPNPDSRVALSNEVDATGMPRINLDWRLTRQDVESVAALVDMFARRVRQAGLGEVDVAPWLRSGTQEWISDPLISAHPIGGYHHMGTTRMADDPKHGVTDRWGRVHGISNLYVAGSSLFPTSGWANPTLTIIALALRTADRIASRSA